MVRVIFLEIWNVALFLLQGMQCKCILLLIMTRNSSGDEIANVNFLYDDIEHVLQNTIDSCINSATDRRGYVLERMCLPNSVK